MGGRHFIIKLTQNKAEPKAFIPKAVFCRI